MSNCGDDAGEFFASAESQEEAISKIVTAFKSRKLFKAEKDVSELKILSHPRFLELSNSWYKEVDLLGKELEDALTARPCREVDLQDFVFVPNCDHGFMC